MRDMGGDSETYQSYAKEYFELDVALEAIARVYPHEPLSRGLLQTFPSKRGFEAVLVDAKEVGCPIKP